MSIEVPLFSETSPALKNSWLRTWNWTPIFTCLSHLLTFTQIYLNFPFPICQSIICFEYLLAKHKYIHIICSSSSENVSIIELSWLIINLASLAKWFICLIWVFVYELSGRRFDSRCSHLITLRMFNIK